MSWALLKYMLLVSTMPVERPSSVAVRLPEQPGYRRPGRPALYVICGGYVLQRLLIVQLLGETATAVVQCPNVKVKTSS